MYFIEKEHGFIFSINLKIRLSSALYYDHFADTPQYNQYNKFPLQVI